MLGPDLVPAPCGLASTAVDAVGDAVVGAWDDFLAVVTSADLERPSRLPGWTGRDTCIHLGSWDDHRVLIGLTEAARAGGGPEPADVDEGNAKLVAAHQDAGPAEVIAALERSRDVIAEWFETSTEPTELATARVRSSVGELPLLSLLHAGCYELAVHALDLGPCDADPPSDFLLDRGLAALLDVTGSLAASRHLEMTVSAQTPRGGWAFTSSAHGWTTQPVPAGDVEGVGVRGTASDLLDVSAGRVSIPALLLSRRLHVQQLSAFMKLAPIVSEVPGLPGGVALKAGVSGLTGLGRLVGRLRR